LEEVDDDPKFEVKMMFVRILVGSAAGFALVQGALAQSAPVELVKARAALAAAVAANDEKSAAELSAFPLINRVDQEKPAIPRSEFRGLFRIYREVVTCLRSGPLEPEKNLHDRKTGNWLVDCGGNFILFGQKNGRWLNIGYENVNE
jgi:hypothetical protein